MPSQPATAERSARARLAPHRGAAARPPLPGRKLRRLRGLLDLTTRRAKGAATPRRRSRGLSPAAARGRPPQRRRRPCLLLPLLRRRRLPRRRGAPRGARRPSRPLASWPRQMPLRRRRRRFLLRCSRSKRRQSALAFRAPRRRLSSRSSALPRRLGHRAPRGRHPRRPLHPREGQSRRSPSLELLLPLLRRRRRRERRPPRSRPSRLRLPRLPRLLPPCRGASRRQFRLASPKQRPSRLEGKSSLSSPLLRWPLLLPRRPRAGTEPPPPQALPLLDLLPLLFPTLR